MPDVSKTQINRLGERLKKGEVSDDDLRLLDDFRRSFSDAYDFVVSKIRDELALEPTGRPAKSTSSIAEKLRRETIRLTQIQDIAGCRLVVRDTDEQEELANNLTALFGGTLVDRRKIPSHGYRAVHVIATVLDKNIEIQIRTTLQHMWAELSEKFADKQGQELKYGNGNRDTLEFLKVLSDLVAGDELLDSEVRSTKDNLSKLFSRNLVGEAERHELVQEFEEMQKVAQASREATVGLFRKADELLSKD